MRPSSDDDERSPSVGTAGEHAPPYTAADAVMNLALGLDWAVLSVLRNRLTEWLRAHRWSAAHIGDLVLAVNEAVTNSIEHGYGLEQGAAASAAALAGPGLIEVHGEIVIDRNGQQRVELTVRDHGRWRPPTSDAPARGDGIRLMRACTDEVAIVHGANGTTVHLRSRPLPTLPSPHD